LLIAVSRVTRLRVSFSITTDREDVRQIFEPHCAPIEDRWNAIAAVRAAGIETVATLAPILPCDPEALVTRALDATSGPVVADPFHARAAKPSGAQTREPAYAICCKYGWDAWLDPTFQTLILQKMQAIAARRGRHFGWGPSGFSVLARRLGTELSGPESYN